MIYPKSIAALIEQFQKFPSVGPKSAQRMAFHLLRMTEADVENFAKAVIEAKKNTHTCEVCFNLLDEYINIHTNKKQKSAKVLKELVI